MEVFSTINGLWELMTQRFSSQISRIYDLDEVYGDGLDGIVHWICYTGEERYRQMIVAFDLSFKNFSEMSLPDSLLLVRYQNVLGFLTEQLCVVACMNGECEV